MTTTYDLNSQTIQVDKWSAFDRTQGVASNIDAIIANCGDNVLYANGILSIKTGEIASVCPDGDNACNDSFLAYSFILTDAELAARYA